MTALDLFEERRRKPPAPIENPVNPFLNQVRALTPDHNVQNCNRETRDQERRDNTEEHKNDQHLPADRAPEFSCVLKNSHWLICAFIMCPLTLACLRSLAPKYLCQSTSILQPPVLKCSAGGCAVSVRAGFGVPQQIGKVPHRFFLEIVSAMITHLSVIPLAVWVANERAFGARAKRFNSIQLAKVRREMFAVDDGHTSRLSKWRPWPGCLWRADRRSTSF